MKEKMTFNEIIDETLLWMIFFSFSALACAITLDYSFLEPYMGMRTIDWTLFFSIMINLGLAGRFLYLQGLKSWTTVPILIGFIAAWWPLFEMPVWILVGITGNFGG